MKVIALLVLVTLAFKMGQDLDLKKKYYPSGVLMSEVVINRKGVVHEKWYFQEGQLQKIYTMVENQHEGPFIEYFKQGSAKKYGFFKENKKDSTWMYYYPSGVIKAKGCYIPIERTARLNNTMDSIIVSNSNNEITSIYKIYSNTIDSLKLYCFDNENGVVFPLTYSLKDSIWSYFDDDGSIIREEFWQKGELVKIKRF